MRRNPLLDIHVSNTLEIDAAAATAVSPGLRSGAWLAGRYRIVKLIGAGGMGTVYLAEDAVLSKQVALKFLDERLIDDGKRCEQLRNEVLLAHEVSHRNVCRTYDLEELEDRWVIKMEYVEGETLAQRLGRVGPLAPKEAVAIAAQIAAGLAAAHERGVIHRDLKPQNIVIEARTNRVVLMDFGLARMAALAAPNGDRFAGTPAYVSPEQALGDELTGRADLYSLGCVLCYMLTGETVFWAESAIEMIRKHLYDRAPDVRVARAEVPAWLAAVIARLLHKDPGDRYADAAELQAALDGPPRRWARAAALAAAAAVVSPVTWLALHHHSEWRPVVLGVEPTYEENADAPVFSPDGALIAYPSDREQPGRFRIYLDSLAGGESRAITPPDVSAVTVNWARDGRSLVVQTAAPTVALVRVGIDGGPPELVVAGAAGGGSDCGAGRLVFHRIEDDGSVRLLVREASGDERELDRVRPGRQILYPRCDTAGVRVGYTIQEGRGLPTHGRSDIYLVGLDGTGRRRLTQDGMQNTGITFHPDGKKVIFSSARGGHHNLYELRLDGGKPVQLTFGEGPDASPDIAPDGRTILFDNDVTNIPIVAYGSDGERRPLTHRAEDTEAIAVAPDGDELAAIVRRAGSSYVVLVDRASGEERTLADGERAVFTPDGAAIVFSQGARLFAVGRIGGEPRLLAELPGSIADVKAGPDGSLHLTVRVGDGQEAWQVAEDGGTAMREAPAPWIEIVPAPAGGWRGALVGEAGAIVAVQLYPPGRGPGDPPAHVIRARARMSSLAWDLDGRSIVYFDGQAIHRFDVADGSDRLLAPAPRSMGAVAPSPDRSIVYTNDLVAHVRRQILANYGSSAR